MFVEDPDEDSRIGGFEYSSENFRDNSVGISFVILFADGISVESSLKKSTSSRPKEWALVTA